MKIRNFREHLVFLKSEAPKLKDRRATGKFEQLISDVKKEAVEILGNGDAVFKSSIIEAQLPIVTKWAKALSPEQLVAVLVSLVLEKTVKSTVRTLKYHGEKAALRSEGKLSYVSGPTDDGQDRAYQVIKIKTNGKKSVDANPAKVTMEGVAAALGELFKRNSRNADQSATNLGGKSLDAAEVARRFRKTR